MNGRLNEAAVLLWLREDGARIERCLESCTGLRFQQRMIEATVHEGQSMSGTTTRPMRLNIRNNTLNKKRIALVHELGHRLLREWSRPDPAAHHDDHLEPLKFALGLS